MNIYSKLMIIIIIIKIFMIIIRDNKDIDKMILIKIYNKLSNHQEIDISEIILYLFNFPDHFIDDIFYNIHIIYFLKYLKYFDDESEEI